MRLLGECLLMALLWLLVAVTVPPVIVAQQQQQQQGPLGNLFEVGEAELEDEFGFEPQQDLAVVDTSASTTPTTTTASPPPPQQGQQQASGEKLKSATIIDPSYYSKAHYDSFSVIIPSHNTARYVREALESVDASIQTFFSTVRGAQQVRAEVVIVDDASTDNSASVIASFIEAKKAQGQTNPTWKLLALQQNVLGGAARNFGVRASTGDVLFFLDSDDIYHANHIPLCWAALITHPDVGLIETQADIDVPDMHPTWKKRVERTIPHTKCLKRKVHELIEGFPEQGIFTRHQDVGYLHSFSASRIPFGRVKRATVAYRCYPGNSLEKQMKKFQTDPAIETIKSEEELGEDYVVRRMLMKRHCAHVLKKATEIAKGNSVEEDPLWAIYQQLLNSQQQLSWASLDYRKIKYRKMMQLAEERIMAGNVEEAQAVLRTMHRYVYNVTEPQPHFYYQVTSLPTTCDTTA